MATTQYSNPSNEVTNYGTEVGGFNAELRTSWPMFRLGTVSQGKQGVKWVYCKASEAVTGTCTLNTSTFLLTDTGGNYTADYAFASGDYGWVRQTAKDLA